MTGAPTGTQADIDVRVGALTAEYTHLVMSLTARCASLAAELASAQAKIRELEARIIQRPESGGVHGATITNMTIPVTATQK